jgi:hypothetical protein
MKTFALKMVYSIGMCSLVFGLLGQPVLSQQATAAKQAAPKKAATRKAKPAEAGAQAGWLSINIVRVKADMLTQYQEFARNETIPALKKGGVKERQAWGTGVFGESYEFVYVTPIESFAQYDSPGPLVKALGEEGARAYGEKARRLILSSHTYGVQTRPDLSLMGNMTGPPKLAVINSIHVLPGKGPAFEALLKGDVLPAVKKAGVTNYFVSQTVFGGDPNEYVTLTLMDSFAEIGKGSPVARGMGGQAAFNRWAAKVGGIIASQERSVGRYLPDLSFQ